MQTVNNKVLNGCSMYSILNMAVFSVILVGYEINVILQGVKKTFFTLAI